MLLVDSHCHLDQLNYNTIHININDMLHKAYKNHIKLFLCIATSIQNCKSIVHLFKKNNNILYSFGIHPLNCNVNTVDLIELEQLTMYNKVIAIGETGLDYYHQPIQKELQKWLFRKHIQLAKKIKKPVIVHSRQSNQDMIQILKEENAYSCKGILHAYCDDINIAKQLLNIGFYISFSGIITFKNSEYIRKILKYIPIDSILIETDSPYLTPVPYRGKENQPAYLYNIAKYISCLKKIDIEMLSEITTNNFYKLFNIESNFIDS
ncbi:Uncharacterized metal-dependent hydrolase YcfH [Buchnera aphidicola (Eriosoma lanigerum)]|uniref:TatD family hydrolase n=1 Tax=Buchnera aphidicola TaxID=9 RepID=UPI003463B047